MNARPARDAHGDENRERDGGEHRDDAREARGLERGPRRDDARDAREDAEGDGDLGGRLVRVARAAGP